jgi:carbamoyltransferase
MSRLVLGINSAHGDAAAALVDERGLVAAIAEERLSRRPHCGGFPRRAVVEVLRIAGARATDLTDVAVARDPRANLAAKLAHIARYPAVNAPRAWQRLRVHREVASAVALVAEAHGIAPNRLDARLHHVEHHLAHVASAFHTSPFERATGFSADGAGDFATSMTAACAGSHIEPRGRLLWPHSIGVFYTALSQFIGFSRFGEEHKVMGLSAYGANTFAPEMRELIHLDDGAEGRGRGLRLDLRFFRHHRIAAGMIELASGEALVPQLWDDALIGLFGPPRRPGDPVTDRDRDLAASLQARFEEIYLALVLRAVRDVGSRDVVIAGGSALNAVANGRLLTERVVDRAYFHPAASDDGTAAGAALHVFHAVHGGPRAAPLRHAYLGSAWTDAQIEEALVAAGLPYVKLARDPLLARAASALAEGRILGWFQGREEWGPRALGNRSILCHPGWPGAKATLNARTKHREAFRPFAPSVLAEKLSTCFHGTHEVPFMSAVYKVRSEWKERLSAVTHEDGTARVQTVRREDNALFHDLLGAFAQRTGIPVLLNTSFNDNEPIVHTPAEAIDCFARTRMDALGVGSFWLDRPDADRPPP